MPLEEGEHLARFLARRDYCERLRGRGGRGERREGGEMEGGGEGRKRDGGRERGGGRGGRRRERGVKTWRWRHERERKEGMKKT